MLLPLGLGRSIQLKAPAVEEVSRRFNGFSVNDYRMPPSRQAIFDSQTWIHQTVFLIRQ